MLKFIFLLTFGVIWGSNADFANVVVDLSHWNEVNFVQAKAAGIIAVVHKATQGTSTKYDDSKYVLRRAQALNQGLLWGAYHFGTKGYPVAQADHFLKTVGNTNGVLLMLDVELNKGSEMTVNEAEQFVNRINEKTGRYPMLYGTANYLKPFNKEGLNKCPLWIAHHTASSQPTLPAHRSSWSLWQYTDGQKGGTPRSVAGIGACDRDRYNGSVQQLRNRWPNL